MSNGAYTESEARGKICPQSYAVSQIDGVREGGPWLCCSSGCMAWRWRDKLDSQGRIQFSGLASKRPSIESRRGYCGLAGKLS